jgi:hypothetical protein
VAKHEKKGKVTAKTSNKITEYAIEGESDKLYVAWLGKNVLAIATDPDDRQKLQDMIGGKGLKGDLAAAISRLDTKAAMWAAYAKTQSMGSSGTMKMIYGHADVKSQAVTADAHLIVGSSAEATKIAAEIKQALPQLLKSLPGPIQTVLGTLKVTAVADDVGFHVAASEDDVLAAIIAATNI